MFLFKSLSRSCLDLNGLASMAFFVQIYIEIPCNFAKNSNLTLFCQGPPLDFLCDLCSPSFGKLQVNRPKRYIFFPLPPPPPQCFKRKIILNIHFLKFDVFWNFDIFFIFIFFGGAVASPPPPCGNTSL